jgi:hypothetical protein
MNYSEEGWIINELRSLQKRGSSQRSCSVLLRVGYNDGFVVRSARPKGVKDAVNKILSVF